jgi:arylsulfatase A-like enzyme
MRRYLATGLGVGALFGLSEGLQALTATAGGRGALARSHLSDYLFVVSVPCILDALAFAVLAAVVLWPLTRIFFRRHEQPESGVALVVGFATLVYLRSNWGLSPELSVGGVVLWSKALMAGFGVALACSVVYRWLVRHLGGAGTVAVVGGLAVGVATGLVSVIWCKRNLAGWGSAGARPWIVAGCGAGAVLVGGLVWWLVRHSLGTTRRRIPARITLGVMVAAAVLGSAEGFRERGIITRDGASTATPLVLITIDTLRADRLSCYGYERIQTPSLDRLASQGVRFETVLAQSSWTLPSFASLFTSTYPTVNGVVSSRNRLDDARTTLAELLQQRGYLTQAFVSNGWLQKPFGLHQGFAGYYHEAYRPPYYWLTNMAVVRAARSAVPALQRLVSYSSGDHVTDLACNWLRTQADGGFFLWIHYMEPHDPYAPPYPFNRTWDEGYRGRWRFRSGLLQSFRTGVWLRPREKRHLEALYDGEIEFVDQCVGRILDTLEETGLAHRSLVVATSDHGEEFWEHDNVGHGHSLYQEVLRVPLIMRWPGTIPEGAVVEEPFRLLDLAPTLLGLLGVDTGPEMQGAARLPVSGGAADSSIASFGEALIYYEERKSVLTDRWKLIYAPRNQKTELYDVESDPQEAFNVAHAQPATRDSLLSLVLTWMEQSEAAHGGLPTESGSRAVVNGALRQQLRAMGYLQ